ncbi:MAG: hypothetical protein E6R08_10195 [Nevskiaceae bacterium]|nr:MAG: hypothetical protein E6R08_10195 [Nevskiaceae bacterium]
MRADEAFPEINYAGRPGESVETHPAYRQIGVSRVSGDAILYGSDFVHRQFIRLVIGPSELHRTHSAHWHGRCGVPDLEIDLSESQWSALISSVNVAGGVPCTLASKDGHLIPRIPIPAPRQDRFAGDLRSCLEGAIASLDQLVAAIKSSGLSKSKQDSLLTGLHDARRKVGDNLTMVAEKFGEHMEETILRAKAEVNAYHDSISRRVGVQTPDIDPQPVKIAAPRGSSDPTR